MLESNILGLRKVSINVPLHFLLSPPLFLIIQTHLGTLSNSIPFFRIAYSKILGQNSNRSIFWFKSECTTISITPKIWGAQRDKCLDIWVRRFFILRSFTWLSKRMGIPYLMQSSSLLSSQSTFTNPTKKSSRFSYSSSLHYYFPFPNV